MTTLWVALEAAGCYLRPIRTLLHVHCGCCLVVLMCFTAGCGTILQGTKQTIRLTSDPTGADVLDEGRKLSVTTPTEVELSRGASHKLCFNKQGYKSVTVPMRRQPIFMWWFFDAFSLGVGNLIDATTGALFEIRPESVHVILEPIEEMQPK
jgi:hypothetical protein